MKNRRKFEEYTHHICSLESEMASQNDETTMQQILKTLTISIRNPNTKYYFRSMAAVEQERKRHAEIKGGKFIVHPMSFFRLYWELAQMVILYIGLVIVPVNFIFGPIESGLYFHYGLFNWTEYIEIITDIVFVIDFVATFFTGYCNLYKKEIHLTFRAIARSYMLSSGFYIDLLCSISVVCWMKVFFAFHAPVDNRSWIFYAKLAGAIKILRLRRFLSYMRRVFELLRRYYYLSIMLRIILLSALLVHWLTCIYVMIIQMVLLDEDRKDYYIYSFQYEMVLMQPYTKMYLIAQFIVVSYLLSISLATGYYSMYMTNRYEPLSVTIFVVYATIGFIFCNFLLILILQIILSMNSSEMKYHSIISQLIKYMEHKDLPKEMQQRILCYYDYRFQKEYFRERTIMEMLSETLSREISLYSCRTLIETVSLLRDLPSEIITEVVYNLKHQVFLYNDCIVKAGADGDCMFFIANGTVAVSTPTGREICHLQDGAYFGEIALISADQKRIANVIAIEICEVYRLDRVHFQKCFETNSSYYKRIEQIAQERMEKTILLEELHKKYLLDRTTKRKMREV